MPAAILFDLGVGDPTIRPGASLSEVKPYLKDIKGIKIDGPMVAVEFK